MRSVALILLLSAAATYAAEPIASGDWSEPVNGLRGRLLLADRGLFNDTRIDLVYLELQNVTDVMGALQINIDDKTLWCGVVDASGKTIDQSPSAADFFTPGPYTLSLPYDSTLRFLVSVSGYGIPKGPGQAFQLVSGFWFFSASATEERYLTGRFAVPVLNPTDIEARRKDIHRGRVWRGTLKLPKIKIPLITTDNSKKSSAQ